MPTKKISCRLAASFSCLNRFTGLDNFHLKIKAFLKVLNFIKKMLLLFLLQSSWKPTGGAKHKLIKCRAELQCFKCRLIGRHSTRRHRDASPNRSPALISWRWRVVMCATRTVSSKNKRTSAAATVRKATHALDSKPSCTDCYLA